VSARRPLDDGLLVTGLIDYAVPWINSCFHVGRAPAECLLYTRIVVEAARRLGLDAYPLAVRYVLYPPGWETSKVVVALGTTAAERAASGATWLEPAGSAERWPGHVLAVVDRRWLVDPTLDQANRYCPALELAPFAYRVPDAREAERWQRGRATATITTTDGTTMRLDARPRDRSFRAEPAWTRDDLALVVAGAVLAVRQRTAHPSAPTPRLSS
jgi:hypothetical protein